MRKTCLQISRYLGSEGRDGGTRHKGKCHLPHGLPLRSWQDLQTFIDKYSAIAGSKRALVKMYNIATTPRFSFLFVDLTQHDK